MKWHVFLMMMLLGMSLGACVKVNQIERGRLANRIMQLEPSGAHSSFVQEVHSIREGSDGGKGQSAGGGCGCN